MFSVQKNVVGRMMPKRKVSKMTGTVYILRGVPGCGKSTLAKHLAGETGKVCEADNYFVGDDGVYRYDSNKISLAHAWCRAIFAEALDAKTSVIVISNTNTEPLHFFPYEDMAKRAGYEVFHLIVENRHGGTNSHGVPDGTLVSMEARIRNNIKLR